MRNVRAARSVIWIVAARLDNSDSVVRRADLSGSSDRLEAVGAAVVSLAAAHVVAVHVAAADGLAVVDVAVGVVRRA